MSPVTMETVNILTFSCVSSPGSSALWQVCRRVWPNTPWYWQSFPRPAHGRAAVGQCKGSADWGSDRRPLQDSVWPDWLLGGLDQPFQTGEPEIIKVYWTQGGAREKEGDRGRGREREGLHVWIILKGGTSSKSIFKGTNKEKHVEKRRHSNEHQVFRGYSSSPSAQPWLHHLVRYRWRQQGRLNHWYACQDRASLLGPSSV